MFYSPTLKTVRSEVKYGIISGGGEGDKQNGAQGNRLHDEESAQGGRCSEENTPREYCSVVRGKTGHIFELLFVKKGSSSWHDFLATKFPPIDMLWKILCVLNLNYSTANPLKIYTTSLIE